MHPTGTDGNESSETERMVLARDTYQPVLALYADLVLTCQPADGQRRTLHTQIQLPGKFGDGNLLTASIHGLPDLSGIKPDDILIHNGLYLNVLKYTCYGRDFQIKDMLIIRKPELSDVFLKITRSLPFLRRAILVRHLGYAYFYAGKSFTSMKKELIENISFTEEEYNIQMEGENTASFDEFIDAILMFVEESGGTLEDAVCMANDTFFGL